MSSKITYTLLFTMALIIVVLSIFSFNLNTIQNQLANENTNLRGLLNQPKVDVPTSSPMADVNSHSYDYVYSVVKDLYSWEGKPTPTYFDWISASTRTNIFGYRLVTSRLDEQLSDTLTKVSTLLNANGWVDSQTEVADGVDGHVRGLEKDGKKLVFSVNDFSTATGESNSRYAVITFEPFGN